VGYATLYDKRAEVIAKKKLGWLTIWNENRLLADQPAIDLKDKNKSRVWRIENRVGSKCLRRRWEIKSWFDLDAMIGDVFNESLDKMRYAELQTDRNRSRWQDHELWVELRKVYDGQLSKYRSGVIPSEVRTVNRMEHEHRLRQNVYGNLVSLAASQGIERKDFWPFTINEMRELEKSAQEYQVPLSLRLAKAEAKYRFR
jgi:hypothetical protein